MNDIIETAAAPPPAARRAPAEDFAALVTQVINNPNLDASKLEALLKMRRELLAEQHREAFHAAFAELSAALPQVRKDGIVQLVNKDGKKLGAYKFARWEDMDAVLRPLLAKYRFALSFTNLQVDGKLVVRATLMRDGYEVTADSPPLPPDTGPGRNSLQAVGSAASYGKRYAAEAVLNIVRQGDDDDAVRAGLAPLTEQQLRKIEQLIKETGSDQRKFLAVVAPGYDRLADVPARDFARLVNALEDKKRRTAGGRK